MTHHSKTAESMRRSRLLPALAASCLALLAACSSGPLPTRLAGLRRVTMWTGQRAAAMLAELHGTETQPEGTIVADYGKAGQLRVWLVHFPDAAHAHRLLSAMLSRLSNVSPEFAQPQQSSDAPGRWLTIGPQGHQALWTSDSTLYWVEGDPSIVMAAMDDLPSPTSGLWT